MAETLKKFSEAVDDVAERLHMSDFSILRDLGLDSTLDEKVIETLETLVEHIPQKVAERILALMLLDTFYISGKLRELADGDVRTALIAHLLKNILEVKALARHVINSFLYADDEAVRLYTTLCDVLDRLLAKLKAVLYSERQPSYQTA